ncbi:MAG: tRNA (adenosine(37)-N6)-threonylcarbamoyltransferase complex dimerization subunit type 1 TsaB [Flavobacteriales bacterium]|nr:tRNA (adenosine(37)-N6)-threonylcarbamoyltransferase complex dimerization subunit type 1 TsaB [Flavobacteriales bacterium]
MIDMAVILCLETSSKNCSVAVSKDGETILLKEHFDENYCHGEQLHVLIEALLKESGIDISDFDAFGLSCGPGSYTGLRIGAASIKGFGFALDKPILAIPTLKSMAHYVHNSKSIKLNKETLICPVLDSRKGEVYMSFYNDLFKEYMGAFACDLSSFSFDSYLDKYHMYFFGPGQYKLEFLSHPNACFLNGDYPSAEYLSPLAEEAFQNHNFVDIAYFEPMYLKDFIPTKSKKIY